jgi:hypothetical protein
MQGKTFNSQAKVRVTPKAKKWPKLAEKGVERHKNVTHFGIILQECRSACITRTQLLKVKGNLVNTFH